MELELKKIAGFIKGALQGDGNLVIKGINSLETASEGDISFFADIKYKKFLDKTNAAAILTKEKIDNFKGPQILVDNPMSAYVKVASLFAHPEPLYSGISESASVHDSCKIGKNTIIYPLVYVGEDAVIGDDVTLYPGTYIGDRVIIGNKTVINPNVSILQDCIIGSEVIIHAGTVIGSDGFGFIQENGKSIKIPQIGIVQIDDQVEIGANNTIDRAALGKTWIQRGVKTDNLVQVAHNVVIGEDSVIVAQAAFGGSSRIGRGVIIGGQVAVSDHVEIGERAMVGSQSGVAKSVGAGEIVSGTTAMPHRLWLKTRGLVMRLPQFSEKIRGLEKRLETLENELREKNDDQMKGTE